jgi:3'(2'), 5'-bisphosphate nucleotidase
MKYEKRLEFAKEVAVEIGKEVATLYHKGQFTVTKIKQPGNQPVTSLDDLVHERLLDRLDYAGYLEDQVVFEEGEEEEISPEKPGSGFTWWIDEIDGTQGLIARNGHFAMHIGGTYNGTPVFGVVYELASDHLYWGSSKGAAHKHHGNADTPLRVRTSRKKPLICVNGHLLAKYSAELEALQMDHYEQGSYGLRMMKIAQGIFDVTIAVQQRCMPWDICAPHAIVKAAGGYIGQLDGKPYQYDTTGELTQHVIIARSKKLYEQVRQTILKVSKDRS